MSDFRHIVEAEPDVRVPESEPYTAGPKGRATIIRGPGKCKRLHFDWVQTGIGLIALAMIASGAGHGWGIDAAILCCGAALALLAMPR